LSYSNDQASVPSSSKALRAIPFPRVTFLSRHGGMPLVSAALHDLVWLGADTGLLLKHAGLLRVALTTLDGPYEKLAAALSPDGHRLAGP